MGVINFLNYLSSNYKKKLGDLGFLKIEVYLFWLGLFRTMSFLVACVRRLADIVSLLRELRANFWSVALFVHLSQGWFL